MRGIEGPAQKPDHHAAPRWRKSLHLAPSFRQAQTFAAPAPAVKRPKSLAFRRSTRKIAR